MVVPHAGPPAVNRDPPLTLTLHTESFPNLGLVYHLGASYLYPIFPFLLFQFTIIILPGLL